MTESRCPGPRRRCLLLQLPLGPFMPVQTQLGGPRRVAAHFHEQRPEIAIVDVEIVVVHVDPLVPCELELPVHLLALNACAFSCATPMKTTPSRTPRCFRKRLATSPSALCDGTGRSESHPARPAPSAEEGCIHVFERLSVLSWSSLSTAGPSSLNERQMMKLIWPNQVHLANTESRPSPWLELERPTNSWTGRDAGL